MSHVQVLQTIHEKCSRGSSHPTNPQASLIIHEPGRRVGAGQGAAAQWPSAAHGPSLLRAQGLWASELEEEWQGDFHWDFSLNKHYLI